MADGELMRLALMAYEAGSDPGLWPNFLERYAQATRADISLIQIHHFAEHRSSLVATFGLKARFRDDYNNHYSRVNVWRENGRGVYLKDSVMLDHEVYPRNLLKRSEFFNDCLRPMGGVYSMAGVIARDRHNALMLTTLRDEHRNGWEISDKRIVGLLLPHVRRAHLVQQRLAIFQAQATVLDGLSTGVVLFSADGQPVYANRIAESIFREEDGLSLKQGVLEAFDSTTSTLLQRAIRHAAQMEVSQERTEALLVHRKSMRRPYQLLVLPMRRRFAQFAGIGMPAALVLITDLERDGSAPLHLIRKLYGLTLREAELANKVASGMSPSDAAKAMGMQYETARTHLKHVYGKMGISRQSELTARIGRIPKLPLD